MEPRELLVTKTNVLSSVGGARLYGKPLITRSFSQELDCPVVREVGLGVVGGILGEFSSALIAQASNNEDQDESKSMLRKSAGDKPNCRADRSAVM